MARYGEDVVAFRERLKAHGRRSCACCKIWILLYCASAVQLCTRLAGHPHRGGRTRMRAPHHPIIRAVDRGWVIESHECQLELGGPVAPSWDRDASRIEGNSGAAQTQSRRTFDPPARRLVSGQRAVKTMKAPSAGHSSVGFYVRSLPLRELVFGVGGEHRGLKLQCRLVRPLKRSMHSSPKSALAAATSAQSISSNPVAVTGARPLLPIAAPDRDRPARGPAPLGPG